MPGKENRDKLRVKLRSLYDKLVYKGGKTREEALEIICKEQVTIDEMYTIESLQKVLFDNSYGNAKQWDTGKEGR